MAQACDTCHRIPPNSGNGSMWPWIKVEFPVAAFVAAPVQAEGMKASIARITQDRQFCVSKCAITYLVVEEEALLEGQRRAMTVTIEGGGV